VEANRLDRVTVQLTGKRSHMLTWADRDALVRRLSLLRGGMPIADAFLAVGASRPVELEETERLALLGAITLWEQQHAVGRDVPEIPAGVQALRRALLADLG
jgi:hypothetical protein